MTCAGSRTGTVREEADCPKIYGCGEDREATFLIDGEHCTRRCDLCQSGHRRGAAHPDFNNDDDQLAEMYGASPEVLAHRPLGDPVPTRWLRPRPVEIRYIGDPPWASRDDPPRRRNRATWCGCARAAPLPDDPLFQVCATAYASDMTLLGSVLLAQRPAWAEDTVTERVFITLCGSARHFAPTTGCSTFRKPRHFRRARPRVYHRDGRLAVSVVQEGLICVVESGSH